MNITNGTVLSTTTPSLNPRKSSVYQFTLERKIDETLHKFSFTLSDNDTVEGLLMSELIKKKRDDNAKAIFTTSPADTKRLENGEITMQFVIGGCKFTSEAFKNMLVSHCLSFSVSGKINVTVSLEVVPTFAEGSKDQWS